MLATLTGFAVVGLAIVVGYIIGRIDLLGPHARPVLAKLAFYVLSPFLLFLVIAESDAALLFSALLPTSALAATVVILLYSVIAGVLWRRSLGETVIGALSAGLVNSNNIGIPLSLYLLGNAAFPAPVLLLQLLIFVPVTMVLLDIATSTKGSSIWRIVGRTASNPIILGSVAGTIVSVSNIELPPLVAEPAWLIANACIPILLISYGLSLYGQRVLGRHGRRRDVLLASVLKLVIMPLAAWVIAGPLFGLASEEVLIIVVLATLPTAQNVFNFAQRYEVGEHISRDTVFITTVGCLPVLLLVTLLLG